MHLWQKIFIAYDPDKNLHSEMHSSLILSASVMSPYDHSQYPRNVWLVKNKQAVGI